MVECNSKNMEKTSKKVLLPLRYAGGKYYVLKQLERFWGNMPHDEYREPFFGGGAVFWGKEKAKYNWINDIDYELVNFLKFINNKNNRDKILKLFEKEREATREKHQKIKNLIPKNILEEVYKFYYLNRTSFSGKMRNPSWGYRPKRSLPPFRWKERIIPCGEKLKNVKITNLDFEKVINAPSKGKNVLIYLDPPYYLDSKKSHYRNSFSIQDHERLSKILKKTKYKFFLSYDNRPEIKKLYSWANIYDLKFYYRQDNSRDNNNKRKIGDELVITNYEI